MPKDECQRSTVEDLSKYRTLETYNKALEIVEDSYKVDLKKTEGIKYECALNKLEYFHIINNYNVDIMHDLYEGCVPFLLTNLFDNCIANKVFSSEDISAYVDNFDYGKLNQHNIPSTITDGKTIKQNSSQTRCLLLHLPFLLYDFKENTIIEALWPSVISMLTIITIVHSTNNSENDLCRLSKAVQLHLECVQIFVGKNLLPKHHFLTHYASIIRLIGPIVYNSTMKYETKHKSFTDLAKVTKNFRDICSYIAVRHQQTSSIKPKYKNDVKYGKTRTFDKNNSENYISLLSDKFNNSTDKLETTKWLQINSFRYHETLFVIHSNNLFEIKKMFFVREKFFFVCSRYEISEYDSFLNSVKVKEFLPINYILIDQSTLRSQTSYERKYLNHDQYIIMDTLELYNLYVLTCK